MRIFLSSVFWICAVLLTFFRLTHSAIHAPIERWDEETNIQVVRESISRQSLPLLYLDGKPFFEKPPVWYWLSALAVAVFGQTLFVYRLTSVAAGFVIIIGTTYLSFRWWGLHSGVLTFLVLITSQQLFVTNAGGYFSSHTFASADLDALQIALMLGSFVSGVYIEKKYMNLLLGCTTAGAVLTKGPLGLLPLILTTWISWRKNTSMRPVVQSWFFALLLIPWYAGMAIIYGTVFIESHVFYHLTMRGLVPLEGHSEPLWFYAKLLITPLVFPAGIFFVYTLIHARNRKRFSDTGFLMSVYMTVAIFLITTVARTRLAWYILPIYPFAALLIGYTLPRSRLFMPFIHLAGGGNNKDSNQVLLDIPEPKNSKRHKSVNNNKRKRKQNVIEKFGK